MLKIIFMGTPEFAVPILARLIQSDYKPAAIFCAPDKPVGRKQILTPPLTKVLAQENNIPAYQPANSHELADTIKSLSYDIVITAAYGLIFPKEVLDAPQYGCLNVHPSLLPKYRGASPIQSAILNGDSETGVTIYKMDGKVDHGPIIAQEKIQMKEACHFERSEESRGSKATRATDIINPTNPELFQILSDLSAELLIEILPDWLAGKITPMPQDDSLASHTKIIKKEDGQIDWQKSAKEIEQQIRAYTPWPSSFGKWQMADGKWQALKIIEANGIEKKYDKKVGEVFLTENGNLAIQTGSGSLIIKKLQTEGGKPLNASNFLRGHKDIIGTVLN